MACPWVGLGAGLDAACRRTAGSPRLRAPAEGMACVRVGALEALRRPRRGRCTCRGSRPRLVGARRGRGKASRDEGRCGAGQGRGVAAEGRGRWGRLAEGRGRTGRGPRADWQRAADGLAAGGLVEGRGRTGRGWQADWPWAEGGLGKGRGRTGQGSRAGGRTEADWPRADWPWAEGAFCGSPQSHSGPPSQELRFGTSRGRADRSAAEERNSAGKNGLKRPIFD